MRRRGFAALVGSAAAGWLLTARAQQAGRIRRIALLLPARATDPEFQARVGAFLQGLQQAGWTIGRDLRAEYRWTEGDAGTARKYAAELIAFEPEVIVADGAGAVGTLLQATRTIPIVFP